MEPEKCFQIKTTSASTYKSNFIMKVKLYNLLFEEKQNLDEGFLNWLKGIFSKLGLAGNGEITEEQKQALLKSVQELESNLNSKKINYDKIFFQFCDVDNIFRVMGFLQKDPQPEMQKLSTAIMKYYSHVGKPLAPSFVKLFTTHAMNYYNTGAAERKKAGL